MVKRWCCKTLTVEGPGKLVVNGSQGYDGVVGHIVVNGAEVEITGGDGHQGNDSEYVPDAGSTGGFGVVGNVTVNSGSVTVTGGNGGDGGNCMAEGAGANGGDGGVGVMGNLTVTGGDVAVAGGNGGNGGSGGGGGGDAGRAVYGTLVAENSVEFEESEDGSDWALVAGGETDEQFVKAEVKYPLWIGGVRVSPTNADDVLGDGTVSFTPAEGEDPAALTLNGANITETHFAYEDEFEITYLGLSPLVISLAANTENMVISGDAYTGIFSQSMPLTIAGEGSLEVKGKTGIVAGYGLTLSGGTVTATGDVGISCNTLAIETGSALNVTGNVFSIAGSVTNSFAGTGWTDVDGTQSSAKIAASAGVQSLDAYKRVQFPEAAVKYKVTLTGGGNARATGGTTKQDVEEGEAMDAVTYAAGDGYRFPATSELYKTTSGVTVARASDAVVTVSGTPTADVAITVPDAVRDPSPAATHRVTAKADPEAGGKAEASAAEAAEGASVTLTATAADGYEFVRWTVEGAGARVDDAGRATARLAVGTADVTATATFRAKGQPDPEPAPAGATVSYAGHVQDVGDVGPVADGDTCGTTGRGLRLEAIGARVEGGTIEYRGHVQGQGWEGSWAADGATSGTVGKGLRLEAIQMRLAGGLAATHDAFYRVHVQNLGWLGWARDGEVAGTAGKGLRAEAVELRVLPVGAPVPLSRHRSSRD